MRVVERSGVGSSLHSAKRDEQPGRAEPLNGRRISREHHTARPHGFETSCELKQRRVTDLGTKAGNTSCVSPTWDEHDELAGCVSTHSFQSGTRTHAHARAHTHAHSHARTCTHTRRTLTYWRTHTTIARRAGRGKHTHTHAPTATSVAAFLPRYAV